MPDVVSWRYLFRVEIIRLVPRIEFTKSLTSRAVTLFSMAPGRYVPQVTLD
jgi:hypothetical protein